MLQLYSNIVAELGKRFATLLEMLWQGRGPFTISQQYCNDLEGTFYNPAGSFVAFTHTPAGLQTGQGTLNYNFPTLL